MRVASVAGLLVGALAGCNAAPVQPIVAGTWGGDNAGLIATDSSAHVHIGCTLGDTRQAIVAGPDGSFDVAGRYDITVHPVSRGPDHPARFAGTVTGIVMTLTITLSDTAVTLGPVRLMLGKEPRMGPCPICRTPGRAHSLLIAAHASSKTSH